MANPETNEIKRKFTTSSWDIINTAIEKDLPKLQKKIEELLVRIAHLEDAGAAMTPAAKRVKALGNEITYLHNQLECWGQRGCIKDCIDAHGCPGRSG